MIISQIFLLLPAIVLADQHGVIYPHQDTCPSNSIQCVGSEGSSCYDISAGDKCCANGSMCNSGYYCGTGNNKGFCCHNSQSEEECAAADTTGTATAPSLARASSSKVNGADSLVFLDWKMGTLASIVLGIM